MFQLEVRKIVYNLLPAGELWPKRTLKQVQHSSVTSYDAIIIFNSETGDPPCEAVLGMLAETEIPAYFVSRSVGYAILGIEGYNPANCPGGANPALPGVGTAGETLTLSSQFDA